jgi:curved DNA-binding protein
VAAYKDYYGILGVSKRATQKEIKSAFRKLAAKFHPDKHPGDKSAEEKFKEINEAYTVLSDPEKRKFYDQYGSAGGRPPFAPGDFGTGYRTYTTRAGEGADFGDFSDFFQSLFGGFGAPGGGVRTTFFRTGEGEGDFGAFQPRPASAEGTLEVTLEQAYRGATLPVTFDGKRVEVTLPKGVRDGARLRLKGQAPGGGDLYLTIRHKPHARFKLEGDDVRVTIDVPDYQAVLGGTVRVPTLDGTVEMTLPPRTSSGRVLRLRGQGWPKKGGGRGDELAEVRVITPRQPTSEQLELYQRLKALSETVETVPG